MKFPDTTQCAKVWILFGAICNIGGWGLSSLGMLDSAGYLLLATVVALSAILWFRLRPSGYQFKRISMARLRWRYRHFFPGLFLVLFGVALIGGILYTPNNYDALTYRFPRILHWVSEHRWHWIAVPNSRMNLSAVGFEWLMAPLFALTHSDRAFFLLNLFPFALLPGLTYATLVQLGISKRVAWYWMWLVPAGGCFAAQAGSIGNDGFSAVYFLAALYFTLRTRTTQRLSDFWIGALAAALLTAAKASNLPLLLPWGLAALPSLRLLHQRLFVSTCMVAVWVGSSFLPMAVMNTIYTGKWTGDPNNTSRMDLKNPVYGLVGNSLQLIVQNAQPPLAPFAKKWNEKANGFLNTSFGKKLHLNFPRIGLTWGEIAGEEGLGLGLGLSALMIISVIFALFQKQLVRKKEGLILQNPTAMLVIAGGWGAILVYLAKMGSESAGRLFAPYYLCALVTAIYLPGNVELVRKRWWKICAGLAAVSILPALLVHPSRPLWPALTVLNRGNKTSHSSNGPSRASLAYTVYRNRPDCLAVLRKYISPEDRVVGFIGADDIELSLWRPFGSRKVVEVSPSSLPLFTQNHYLIFTRTEGAETIFNQPFDEWLKTSHATIVGKEAILEKASAGPQDWYVLRLAE